MTDENDGAGQGDGPKDTYSAAQDGQVVSANGEFEQNVILTLYYLFTHAFNYSLF